MVLAVAVQRWHVYFVVDGAHRTVGAIGKCANASVRDGLKPSRPSWGIGYEKRSIANMSTELIVQGIERVIDHPHVPHDRHVVRIPAPARDDVRVQMVG